MPKIRGITGQRVFRCERSGYDFRWEDMVMEDGKRVAKKFAKPAKTHADYMAEMRLGSKTERPAPDVRGPGITHKG